MSTLLRILVVGATGAQGGSVARHLLRAGSYKVRCLTRRPASPAAKEIAELGAEGFPKFDCKGKFAGNCVSSLTTAVNPELRTRLRIGWETPWNVDLALTHRYISSVSQDDAVPGQIDAHLPHESYFDLFGSWNMTDNANVRLGINNITDNDPSLSSQVGTTGNGNTYPQVYDALGRYIFMGLTVKL